VDANYLPELFRRYSGALNFDGWITGLCMATAALSEAECAALRDGDLPASVLFFWPFDEGTGSTATDSEASNVLTLTGHTWLELSA
jgi:hypothetical protein